MEVLLGVLSVLLLLYWLLTPSSRVRQLGNKIPGPKALPIVGNALNFNVVGTKAFHDFKNGRKEFGRTYRIWLGPQLHVFLAHHDDVQMLLSSPTLITKSTVYDVLNNWLGTGLLLSTGDLWHRRRKAITPTFHFKVLDDSVPVFNKCGEILVSCLKEKAGKGTFDISSYISNCALDAISESAMGIQVEAQMKPRSAYVLAILEMTKILGKKINFPWLGIEPIYTFSGYKSEEKKMLKTLQDLPGKVLNEKKAATRNVQEINDEDDFGIKKRKAFLERLLSIQKENSDTFRTDQDVMDEVTTFMFEGHDTTTAALSFTVWLIGKHQDVQESVYREVSSIMNQNPKLKIEDLQEMKCLERVIKESLRLYPPVPIIGRRLEKDTTFPSGYTVPAGSDVYTSIIMIQRDPEYFPEPEKFNPDRFLVEQKYPYVYIPFSAGPRNCIGQKFAMLDLKAILAQLVYNYKITTDHDLILDHEMILRVDDGINVSLTQRNVSS